MDDYVLKLKDKDGEEVFSVVVYGNEKQALVVLDQILSPDSTWVLLKQETVTTQISPPPNQKKGLFSL